MVKKHLRVVVLVLLTLAFSGSMRWSVDSFKEKASQVLPNRFTSVDFKLEKNLWLIETKDIALVWVDIRAWVDEFGDLYLPEDPALHGINWIMITFDPDITKSHLFWCLAETKAEKVEEISEISWVENITLIRPGRYVRAYENPKFKTDGIEYAIQRAISKGNKSLEIMAYVNNQTIQLPTEVMLENVTASIIRLGGDVLRKGPYKNKLVAQVLPYTIDKVAENSYVSEIYLGGPIVFEGRAVSGTERTKVASFSALDTSVNIFGYFVILGIMDLVISNKKIRRKKIVFYVTAILSMTFLVTLPSSQALNISTSVIRATSVWNKGNSGAGVVIAIIDGGIDYNHPDFQGAIVHSFTYGSNAPPIDTSGHGTHVAGIIAGRGVMNILYRGIAWEASLVIIRLRPGHYDDLDDAIRWVRDNKDAFGIQVLSLSVAAPGYPTGCDGSCAYCRAVDDAVSAGIVVVKSAGNRGAEGARSITCPGNAFNVITVGAIDDQNTQSVSDDILANFSSRGPTGGDERIKPEVIAPGVRIISCRAAGTDIRVPGWDTYIDNNYVECTGTSMAAPHVAGVAALLLQAHPDWSPYQVKDAIMGTAMLNDNLQALTENDRGKGIVDAERSVKWDLESQVGLGNPSFEQRLESVWTIPYWCTNISNYQNNWRELRGDINGDKWCEMMDSWLMGQAYGSYPGHPKWDPRCDLNGDNYVEMMDYLILYQDYGKQTKSHNDNYSGYINGESEYAMWQWLCDYDINISPIPSIYFTFWFYPNGTQNVFNAKILYIDKYGQENQISGGVFNVAEAEWHCFHVDGVLIYPVAIKVIIYTCPNIYGEIDGWINGWIDETSVTIYP